MYHDSGWTRANEAQPGAGSVQVKDSPRSIKGTFAYPSVNVLHQPRVAFQMGQSMSDREQIRQRLEAFRGQLLNWGTPEAQVSVTTKDELRGWIRALEWVLGRNQESRTEGP